MPGTATARLPIGCTRSPGFIIATAPPARIDPQRRKILLLRTLAERAIPPQQLSKANLRSQLVSFQPSLTSVSFQPLNESSFTFVPEVFAKIRP
jgi:hypothetical protein